MTFVLPEGFATKSSFGVLAPGWDAGWAAWMSGFAQNGGAADGFLDAQRQLFETSLKLMMMPWTLVPAGLGEDMPTEVEPAAAEVAPEVAPALPVAIPAKTEAPAATPAAPEAGIAGIAPTLLAAPEGKADDLLLIRGIGPKLNQLLNSLGVWHYRQIVSWTPAEVAWVNDKIDFRGRIERERWQEQASELMKPRQAA